MSLSDDQSKAQTMIDPFTVFKFQWDAILSFDTLAGGAVPGVSGRFVNTGITALQHTGYLGKIPFQYQKLQYMFNMYEEFTILEDRTDYEPLFNKSDVLAFQQADWTSSPGSKADKWVLLNSLFANTSKLTIIADKNDHHITNDVDTYYQVRSRPEARTFKFSTPWSYATRPTANDLRIIANPSNSDTSQGNNPFIANVIAGVSNTASWAEWGPPEKLGWLPTKVMSPNNLWVLNLTPNYYGYKQYAYIPIAGRPAATVVVDYGMVTHTLTFAFRKHDYRPNYALSNPSALIADQEQIDAVLDDATGRGMIRDVHSEPVFKKVKTDQEVEQDHLRSRVVLPESL